MKKITVFISLLFVFIACSKEKLNNKLVEGNWKWERTIFGEPSGRISQPGTEETYILSFKANKTFTYKKNDSLLRSGNYEVKKQKSNLSRNEEWLLIMSDNRTPYLIDKDNSKLYLTTDAWDGPVSEYNRY